MNIKVKSIVIFIGLITLLASFASSAAYATDVTLDVPEIEQEHSQWCWAGTSESVLAYYGETASQCDIANWTWSRSDCCTGSLYDWTHDCNQTNSMYSTSGSIQDILDNWGVGPISTNLSRQAMAGLLPSSSHAPDPGLRGVVQAQILCEAVPMGAEVCREP